MEGKYSSLEHLVTHQKELEAYHSFTSNHGEEQSQEILADLWNEFRPKELKPKEPQPYKNLDGEALKLMLRGLELCKEAGMEPSLRNIKDLLGE